MRKVLFSTSYCLRSLVISDSTAQSRGELERARIDAALAPAVVDTWPYRARNTLFYAPDAMGAEESNDGTAQVCVRAAAASACGRMLREGGDDVVVVDFCSIWRFAREKGNFSCD